MIGLILALISLAQGADVIHRTTLEQRFSVHTPDFSSVDWIAAPDLSALSGVPKKYWKIVGDSVLEMNASEKTTADSGEATQKAAAFFAVIKESIYPPPVQTILASSSRTGMTITTNVTDLITNDEKTVTSDPTRAKEFRVMLVYARGADQMKIFIQEKINSSNYSDFNARLIPIYEIDRYSVVAGGTVLVKL